MMARQHVAFGTALYVTSVGTLAHFDIANMGSWSGAQPAPLLLSAFVVALGCLVPDLDHHNSTLSRKLGIARRPVVALVTALAGGHRKGMHSIFLPLLLGIAVYLGALSTAGTAVVLMIAANVVTRFLLPAGVRLSGRAALVVGLALVALLLYVPGAGTDGHWLVVAAVAGPLLHDLGDALTDGRVGWIFPIAKPFAILPKAVRFPTGGFFEKRMLGPVFSLWVVTAMVYYCALPGCTQMLAQV